MGTHNYKFTPPKKGWPEFDEEGNIINESDDEVGAQREEASEEARDEGVGSERISAGEDD